MPLPIFTIQTFNQNTLQPAGAVFAQRVEAVSVSRNFLAGITGSTGSTGGRNTTMEKKMNDLTKALMEELQLQTRAAFPNAVALVDVKMHFSDIGKDESNMFLAGQASATALIKRNKPMGSSMASAPMASAPMASAPMASGPMGPMAPMASAPMGPIASGPMGPMATKNNTRMLNRLRNPINFENPTSPARVGGKRNFISKSRKNRI